jgi:hypothetical protein
VPDFGPSNEHELEIARIVDNISIEGRLYSSAAPEVLALLGFVLSRKTGNFSRVTFHGGSKTRSQSDLVIFKASGQASGHALTSGAGGCMLQR